MNTTEYGLVSEVLDRGGEIHPIFIPPSLSGGTGIMNPSIFNDRGKLVMNIRHVNYVLYHSEGDRFHHQYGPLQYLHPENDRHLRTTNYIADVSDSLEVSNIRKVDTSKLDTEELWEFTGLEDARLFKWNEKMYLCGVRRDTTPHGEGRMELSEISITEDTVKEISRTRIPAPAPNNSYCEKNWMPILDEPYRFIKWSNPTEIVSFGEETKTEFLGKQIYLPNDLRGGSQAIPWGGGHLAITHEVSLFKSIQGSKNGTYKHRFVWWDKDWNLGSISDAFSFMGGNIEFCCGAALYKDDLLISFSFQDNAAFILRMPEKLILEVL